MPTLSTIITFLKELPAKVIDFLGDNAIEVYVKKKTTNEIVRNIKVTNTFIIIIIVLVLGVLYIFFS